ncbi:MAG: MFS transporter [Sphingosinicella sp.]|uniref:MFS transporter n=1 Tax=Sphingosinicella sp. TaxID=1917971 RepID=UPI00403797C8
MNHLSNVTEGQRRHALATTTIAFTTCFAIWTIFSIIGVQIQRDLDLTDTQFGLLVGMPILTGSLSRLILGIWADQFGGRIVNTIVMLTAAVATFLLSYATTYGEFLIAALGVGMAGGCFSVGVAYVSRWYPRERQGTALGIFGMGNVGSAVTKFTAPFVMVAYGWTTVAQVWALVLAAMAFVFYAITKDDPVLVEQRRTGEKPQSAAMQLQPLLKLQVWRFSLYYFFVFGAFVALALWLPRYYVGVYGLSITTAGMLAAAYSIPGSVFRAVGGWMSDKWGARTVMYWTFGVSIACTFLLSYPTTHYVVEGIDGPIAFTLAMGVLPFTILTFILGFFMSLGKAAVYKHIPVYYPDNVGSVGGLVGMIGGLGGFLLPIAFGMMNDLTGIWTSCFMLLFVLVAGAMAWMHFAVLRMERKAHPELKELPELPEMHGLGADPAATRVPGINTRRRRPRPTTLVPAE